MLKPLIRSEPSATTTGAACQSAFFAMAWQRRRTCGILLITILYPHQQLRLRCVCGGAAEQLLVPPSIRVDVSNRLGVCVLDGVEAR
jgi:hypothetical protein